MRKSRTVDIAAKKGRPICSVTLKGISYSDFYPFIHSTTIAKIDGLVLWVAKCVVLEVAYPHGLPTAIDRGNGSDEAAHKPHMLTLTRRNLMDDNLFHTVRITL